GALRKVWQIPPAARILLVPGRVAPWNGQLIVPEIARTMLDSGMRGFVFVLAGEHRTHRKYARAVMEQAQRQGDHRRIEPRRCRVPHDGRTRTPLRRVHVWSA